MGRNLTINLDEGVIRKAKILAAKRGLSVSALLRSEILRLVEEEEAYQAARESARRRLAKGSRLGGGPLPKREELYDRG
jgi:plasmid stability protein